MLVSCKKLPEDYLKKIETHQSISELYVKVYFQYLFFWWC